MAHPLPEEWRGLMRGIASEKNAAPLPLLGDQPMETVGGGADDATAYILHVRRDQRSDERRLHHLRVVLARQQHELPAAMIAAARHQRRWTLRIAQHHREMLQVRIRRHTGEIRKVDRSVDLGIDNQPGLLETKIGEADAERLAHE